MFVHGGFFGNHTLVKKLYTHFEDRYTVIAPDLRGKGDSGDPPDLKKQKLDDYAHDLYEILKNEKLESVIIVGVSFGGLVSLKFHEMFSSRIKVEKLVLVSSTYTFRYAKRSKLIKAVLPRFKSLVDAADAAWPFNGMNKDSIDYSRLPDRFFHLFYGSKIAMNNSVKTILTRYKVAFPIWDYEISTDSLKKIETPTLIIAGKKDRQIPYAIQSEMIRSIKNSKYHIFLNSGHNLYLSKHERASKIITDFLN